MLARLLLALGLVLVSGAARAHLASDSYLRLELAADGGVGGQWDIALRDLDSVVGLDADSDGKITWGELRRQREAVERYAFDHLTIANAAGICVPSTGDFLVDRHAGNAYAVIGFRAACPPGAGPLTLDYRLLFDVDPTHRGLLTIVGPGGIQTAILSPDASRVTVDLAAQSVIGEIRRFLAFGFEHILLGYDHLLFVAVLLITASLRRVGSGEWVPIGSLFRVIGETVKVLTAFTLAHATTLTLAVLGVLDVPSRLVDPAIAATIMAAAVDNIRPVLLRARWGIAFGFGLIHGLAFAAALGPMRLPAFDLGVALGCFNLGVEGGQIALALLVVPITFVLRKEPGYRRLMAPALSAAAFVLAAVWFVDRVFALDLLQLRPAAQLLSGS